MADVELKQHNTWKRGLDDRRSDGQSLRRAQAEPDAPPDDGLTSERYDRIGGWLLLIGIGVALNPLVSAPASFLKHAPFFDGTWQTVTTPGSPSYHRMWSIVLPYELLMNSALAIWSVYMAFLFFGKRKSCRESSSLSLPLTWR